MQKPFIDLGKSIEYNLAHLGFTISHEMSHSLDDVGSQYDYKWKLHNWWTEEDKKKCLDLYSSRKLINSCVTNVSKINVGQICNPIITYDVINTDLKFNGKHVFTDKKNILNTFTNIPKILLFGIDDKMPFITPDVYPKEKINKLLKSV